MELKHKAKTHPSDCCYKCAFTNSKASCTSRKHCTTIKRFIEEKKKGKSETNLIWVWVFYKLLLPLWQFCSLRFLSSPQKSTSYQLSCQHLFQFSPYLFVCLSVSLRPCCPGTNSSLQHCADVSGLRDITFNKLHLPIWWTFIIFCANNTHTHTRRHFHRQRCTNWHWRKRLSLQLMFREAAVPPKPFPWGLVLNEKHLRPNTVWIQNTFLAVGGTVCVVSLEKQIISIQISMFFCFPSDPCATTGQTSGKTQFGWWLLSYCSFKLDIIAASVCLNSPHPQHYNRIYEKSEMKENNLRWVQLNQPPNLSFCKLRLLSKGMSLIFLFILHFKSNTRWSVCITQRSSGFVLCSFCGIEYNR